MAYFPCAWGDHYNPTKNYLLYAARVEGTQQARYRLRMCAGHVRDVQEYLSEFKVDPQSGTVSGGDEAMAHCFACRKPVDKSAGQLFVTCYPTNNEREDYWAHVHLDCSLPTWLSDRWLQKSA